MSRYVNSEAESNERRDAGAPYPLPSRPLGQNPTIPRQPSALPSSPTSLQQYSAAASQYANSYDQYTAARQDYVPQYAGSSKGPLPQPPNPTTSFTSYSRKRLFIFYFKEHDLGGNALDDELDTVHDLFLTQLGFSSCTRYAIENSPTTPTDQLVDALTAFTRACIERNELLVVYYGGHGAASISSGLMMVDRSRNPGSTVYWKRVQTEVLFVADADVLVLLDCCYAESGIRGRHHYHRDTIAACESMQFTKYPGRRSFTACMVEAANQLLRHGGFTARQLYNQTAAVAATVWYDGGAPARQPVYDCRRGDPTIREIYFERPTSTTSNQPNQPCAPPASNRPRIAPRSGAQPDPVGDEDDDSISNSEGSDDDDVRHPPPPPRRQTSGISAQSTNATASQTDQNQRRVQVRSAWSRMKAQGHTPAQAFGNLVRTLQTSQGLSAEEADRQIRDFLR